MDISPAAQLLLPALITADYMDPLKKKYKTFNSNRKRGSYL